MRKKRTLKKRNSKMKDPVKMKRKIGNSGSEDLKIHTDTDKLTKTL
jgi:hypothetical protein